MTAAETDEGVEGARTLGRIRTALGSRRAGWIALAFLALLPVPYLVVFGELPFFVSVLIEVFVFAIFAVSFNYLMGYTGYVSFGHTAFLGAGAYATALLLSRTGLPFELVIPLAVLVTAAIAVPIGLVAFRRKGVYFAMITLGVAQVPYTVFRRWGAVGGTTGIGIDEPSLLGWQFDVFHPVGYYYLGLLSLVLVYGLTWYLVRSPFGHVLRAIRENEERAEAVGYDVFRFKIAVFVLAGALAGYAGVIYAVFFTQVAPQSTLYWTTTGRGLFMVLIGGIGTVVGPILGSFFVIGLEYVLTEYLGSGIGDRWPLFLGLVFMATVLYFSDGIAGGLGITGERSIGHLLDDREAGGTREGDESGTVADGAGTTREGSEPSENGGEES